MKTPTEHESDTGDAGTDDRSDLAALDAKIRAHTEAHRQKNPEPAETGRSDAALGTALRLTTELVAGPFAGGLVGWTVDYLFGTTPWFLMIFVFLGMGAGILNVFRTAQSMGAADAEKYGKPDSSSDTK